ncbi:MAG TPA: GNAT family N-acetyltransferase [Roseomonas sp.]|jgi:RimJ/RimL family protein N-acetyltransferase
MAEQPRKPLVVSLRGPAASSLPAATGPRPAPPVMLTAGRYHLRNLTAADATPRFLAWLNSQEMLRGLNLTALNFTLEQLQGFLTGFDNLHGYLIGIFDSESDLLVGFYNIEVNLTHKVALISTGIGEKGFEGKGALWATNDVLLDYLYLERDIDKVSARILARNHRMLFNFKSSPSFYFEARLKDECLAPNGDRVDILVFAALKPVHLARTRPGGTATA